MVGTNEEGPVIAMISPQIGRKVTNVIQKQTNRATTETYIRKTDSGKTHLLSGEIDLSSGEWILLSGIINRDSGEAIL